MTRVEKLEQTVEQLSPDELATFGPGSSHSMPPHGIVRSRSIARPASWTGWRKAPWNHFASPAFWDRYQRLPQHIRELADAQHALLKENPSHARRARTTAVPQCEPFVPLSLRPVWV